MFGRILITTGLVSAGLILIIVTMTTPVQASAFGILAVFLLSYVVVLTLTTYIVWFGSLLVSRLPRKVGYASRRSHSMSIKRAYYFSTVIALGPILMVSLQSVGGTNIYDVGLIATLLCLGCIYVAKRTAQV